MTVGQALQSSYGPLAQLVERFHGMEEVNGSIPLGSTMKNVSGFPDTFFILFV